jgi:uncharacterized protein YdhG (YjbR/CyaY superfamily)
MRFTLFLCNQGARCPASAGIGRQPGLTAMPAQNVIEQKAVTWTLGENRFSVGCMKKPTSRSRPPAKATPKTVEEYLAGVPVAARSSFDKLRAAIRAGVPREAIETISYGIPAFKHNGIVVWFGAFSNHCSLFPTAEIIEAFRNELEGFSTSKGTIHFPVDKPLPVALIKKLVKARVAKQENKKR